MLKGAADCAGLHVSFIGNGRGMHRWVLRQRCISVPSFDGYETTQVGRQPPGSLVEKHFVEQAICERQEALSAHFRTAPVHCSPQKGLRRAFHVDTNVSTSLVRGATSMLADASAEATVST